MTSARFRYVLRLIAISALLAQCALAQSPTPTPAQAKDEGRWETVYVKRGFMGELGAGEKVFRNLFIMPVDGTRVRIFISPSFASTLLLSRMTLAKGADGNGTIVPPAYTINFKGSPSYPIPPRKDHPPITVSDEMPLPVTAGFWYLQESYDPGSKIPYNYDVDGGFRATSHEEPSALPKTEWRGQVAWRIDVWTGDTRPLIACYGDSITQGYGATPLSGNRYPDLLGKALNQPVLNIGVNGDTFDSQATYGAVGYIQDLSGVDIVVFLLGINDIMTGKVKSVADYARWATRLVDGFHKSGKKVIWGTLMPGTGYKAFSDNPDKETLRQAVNTWIRSNAFNADGIVDFDAALVDPKDPKLVYYAYQKDWLHPNDEGNQIMARVAADAVRKLEAGLVPGVK